MAKKAVKKTAKKRTRIVYTKAVVVNDGRKQFRFQRKALLGSLFYLEQQLSTGANCVLYIGGLERAPHVFG